jgi:hypothetical protein
MDTSWKELILLKMAYIKRQHTINYAWNSYTTVQVLIIQVIQTKKAKMKANSGQQIFDFCSESFRRLLRNGRKSLQSG